VLPRAGLQRGPSRRRPRDGLVGPGPGPRDREPHRRHQVATSVRAMGRDLAFAHDLADAADAITLGRFRALDLRVETKPDLTPVTEADKATEEAIRDLVAKNRPGEGVLGEEHGDDGGDARLTAP